MEIDRIETYQTAAQLALITGRFTPDDYVAVLECLQTQVQKSGIAKARAEVLGGKAISGS